MSHDYEQSLAATRRWLEAQPPERAPLGALWARCDQRARARRRRHGVVLAIAACVLLAWVVSMVANPITPTVCPWVTPGSVARYGAVHVMGSLLGAALAVLGRGPGAYLVARALWWSSMLAAGAGLWLEPGTLPLLLPVMAIGSAICVWVLAHDDRIVPPGEAFDLVAHRTTMTLVMILALADVETLMMAALNHEHPDEARYLPLALGGAVGMGIALWGLYRLRTWGLLLNLGLNLVIAGLGLMGGLLYDPGFAYLLAGTAVAQLGLSTPLLVTLVRRRRPPPARASRGRGWVRGLVFVVLVVDLVAVVRAAQPEVIAAYCAP